ncbi:MAG: hypothetical protein ABIO99_11500 [Candidatus Limnocylindria bacterium]
MKRLIRPALGALAFLALATSPVLANHTHVMQLGNGQCVVLAANGGEENVQLPLTVFDHNPNVDIALAADRMHPLHVLVHQGVPGDHNAIAVAGTPAAHALCAAGNVNH